MATEWISLNILPICKAANLMAPAAEHTCVILTDTAGVVMSYYKYVYGTV